RALRELGYAGSITLKERGYFPRGGGKVSAIFEPCRLHGFHFRKKGEDKGAWENRIGEGNQQEGQGRAEEIMGISHAANLPAHVPARQAEAAKSLLLEAGHN